MTDTVKGLVVTLDSDIREDDVQMLVDAILCLKRVVSVKTEVVNMDEIFARQRINIEWANALRDFIAEKMDYTK